MHGICVAQKYHNQFNSCQIQLFLMLPLELRNKKLTKIRFGMLSLLLN